MDAHEAQLALARTTTGWEKSRFSNGGDSGCIELNFTVPGWAGLRDSKLGTDSPVLVFNEREISAFVAAAKDGQFTDRIQ